MRTAYGMLYEFAGVFPPPEQAPAEGLLTETNRAPSKLWPAGRMPENGYELVAARRSGRIVRIYQDLTGVAYANTYPFVTYAPSGTAAKKTPITDIFANVINSAPIPGLK